MCFKLKKASTVSRSLLDFGLNISNAAIPNFGLIQSTYDPCLFYGKDLLVSCFVDVNVFCAKAPQLRRNFISKLCAMNFELTKEDSRAEYLGQRQSERHDHQELARFD
jgi:hypothetical protein